MSRTTARTMTCGVVLGFSVALVASQRSLQSLEAIIYVSNGELVSVTSDGSRSTPCDKSANVEFASPAWNPSGSQFVAEVTIGDSSGLALFSRQCELISQLPNASGFMRPVWGPGGTHIYALSNELDHAVGRWRVSDSAHDTIPIVAPDSMAFRQMEWLTLAPGGRRVAILVDNRDTRLIAQLQPGTLLVTRKMPGELTSQGQAVWLSNDELAVVAIGPNQQTQSLWSIVLSTGSVSPLSDAGFALKEYVARSPNGHELVVTASRVESMETWNLWRFTRGELQPQKLTSGSEDISPSWRR